MYLNKALVYGNMTRDPELRSLPSGIQVTSFSLATNRVYKDKEGNKQESTDFHNIVVFGRQAETVAQYMRKGSQVMIEGRMQTRSWDDAATGTKKYRTEVIADRVSFGSSNSNTPKNNNTQSNYNNQGSQEKDEGELDTIKYPEEQINAEDIPF